MDLYEESDHFSDYNSDQIDSETEVRLYGAIHHGMAADDQHLVPEVPDSQTVLTKLQTNPQPIKSQETIESKDISNKTKISSDKPLNNLFRLLDSKLDQSDEDFSDDFHLNCSKDISYNANKRKVDVIEIDDSSEDSDVVIIEDNSRAKEPKTRSRVKQISPKKTQNILPNPKTKIDISLGNVNNLKKTSLEVMNEFYDEDNYDSEEEAKNFSRMSSDRNHWKVSHNDILLTNKKNNRYYKNKFICYNCNERGHQARDCPLPKKSPTCSLCGLNGHKSDRCRSILCSLCFSVSHRYKNCNVSVNQLVCDECGLRGHKTNQCTYNWRKYHLTTTFSKEEPMISELRSNWRMCCYNCGAIGKHFGFECSKNSTEKRMTPVSVLMPNTRKSHCFNGRQPNNRSNDSSERVLFNEFVKRISGNELSRLSASFNKPLDRSDLAEPMPSTSAAIASTFNNKNKHIKWHYPETNGTTHLISSSYSSPLNDSTPFKRKSRKNRGISEPTQQTILYSNTTAFSSAHTLTLTPTQTHQQINNSMQERSQTTPQLNERSKRRKNRRKKRKIDETEDEEGERGAHQSFKQPNGSNFKSFRNLGRIKRNMKRFKRKKKLL